MKKQESEKINLLSLLSQFRNLLCSRNLIRVTGLGLFIYLLSLINFSRIISLFLEADISLLLLGFLLGPLLVFVRAFRWKKILMFLDIPVSILNSFLYSFIGQVGAITPGKVGEFIKAIYLKEKNYPLADTVISIIADRIYDLVTIFFLAGITFVFLFIEINQYEILLIASTIIVLAIVLFILQYHRNKILNLLEALLIKFVPVAIQPRINRLVGVSGRYLRRITLSHFFFMLSLSVVSFLIQVVRIQFFCLGLGIQLDFMVLVALLSLVVISTLLPVSVAGLGTRDATIVYILGLYDIGFERAMSLSFLLLFAFLSSALLGALLITLNPPDFRVINT